MDGFTPVLWPEHTPPPEVADCRRCELWKQRSRVIWGEGNPKAPVLIVLDNPGAREDREGKDFVCGVRQTLQAEAHRAGFAAEDMYVTYILKCRPRYRYDKEAARGVCREFLLAQVREQQPQLAFCLGDTAVQWFFGDMDLSVKALRGRWHLVRGLPTAVSYHPLAVRRRPSLLRVFREDWELLKRGDGSPASNGADL